MNYKILVNKNNPYQESLLQNRNLKRIVTESKEEFYLESKTLKAYLDLKKTLEKINIYITLVSGYRSVEEQASLRLEYEQKYGLDYTNNYVALSSFSEHHTGLCFDISLVIDGKVSEENDLTAREEAIFRKIHPLLSSFGLILRYPKDKEEITGYSYEAWHFRYVGKKTAHIIMENNLTLEEYDNLYNKSGVLVVNKPSMLTSRDVVNKISNIFDTKKVGHNGTLDPLAEGVLVVTINKATKINELLISTEKEYIATVRMGLKTDTLDITGMILATSNLRTTKDELENLFQKFPREYFQEVPKYSAVKIEGKKLYEYARENKEIELPKRLVTIKELELLDFREDTFTFRTVVSKGTYIRSLINDIGEILAVPCTMEKLIRTRQGNFSIKEAIELDDVKINSKLISIAEALNIPVKEVLKEDSKLVKNGGVVSNKYQIKDRVLFKEHDKALAIYQVSFHNKLECFKMLT